MNKKYTIKDIAVLAGVSKGTVDRVLHKRGKVSDKALEDVNKVLAEINYEPNFIARNLKNTKVYRLCVVMPDPVIDPYWFPCVKGINDAMQEYKVYNLVIETYYFDPNDTESFLKLNESILNTSTDAVLLVPLFHKETLQVIQKYHSVGILINIFNNQLKSDVIASFVGQDLFRSGRIGAKLLDLLLDKGEIVIIHIDETFENAIHMQEKERGFRDYFYENKKTGYSFTTLNLKSPDVEVGFSKFLKTKTNLAGIFVTTSRGYQIAKAINDRPIKSKIRFVGYDLIDENVHYLNENIIDFLIHQNPKRQVYLAICSLVEYFLFDKEIPNTIQLPIDIINSENVDFYIEKN
jgi:LacI family transcriptional regulator